MRGNQIQYSSPITIVVLLAGFTALGCKKKEEAPLSQKAVEMANDSASKVKGSSAHPEKQIADDIKKGNEDIGDAKNKIAAAQSKLKEELNEARNELSRASSSLRDKLQAVVVNEKTFVTDRDRVVADIRAAITQLQSRTDAIGEKISGRGSALPAGSRDLYQEIPPLISTATKRTDALATATASSWPHLRDEAITALNAAYDKTRQAADKAYE